MSSPTVVREPGRARGADVDLLRVRDGARESVRDLVAVEEPLEIRLNGWRWIVTMRTPGDDADLVVGLLASEGVIERAEEVEALVFTRHPEEPELANVAEATLGRPLAELQARLARHQTLSTASCGLCGASAVEALLARRAALPPGPPVDAATLAALPERLAAAQPVFCATGGLHAAALFDAAGTLLAAREDIGRHNATDKVLGWRLRAAAPGGDVAILLVSGRASFEIVQKAMVARVPIVAAVSAPSSLAVTLADEARMTLVGFVRGGSVNVYTGLDRVAARRSESVDAGSAVAAGGAATRAAAAADPADPLELISRAVRDALDRAGMKISLVDWQALARAERARLAALAEDAHAADADAAFAAYLEERVLARTGRPPRRLDASKPKPAS